MSIFLRNGRTCPTPCPLTLRSGSAGRHFCTTSPTTRPMFRHCSKARRPCNLPILRTAATPKGAGSKCLSCAYRRLLWPADRFRRGRIGGGAGTCSPARTARCRTSMHRCPSIKIYMPQLANASVNEGTDLVRHQPCLRVDHLHGDRLGLEFLQHVFEPAIFPVRRNHV